jgi:hypothetical protein
MQPHLLSRWVLLALLAFNLPTPMSPSISNAHECPVKDAEPSITTSKSIMYRSGVRDERLHWSSQRRNPYRQMPALRPNCIDKGKAPIFKGMSSAYIH